MGASRPGRVTKVHCFGGDSISDFVSEVSGDSSREFQAWRVFPKGGGQMAVSRNLGSRAFPDFMAHFPRSLSHCRLDTIQKSWPRLEGAP